MSALEVEIRKLLTSKENLVLTEMLASTTDRVRDGLIAQIFSDGLKSTPFLMAERNHNAALAARSIST